MKKLLFILALTIITGSAFGQWIWSTNYNVTKSDSLANTVYILVETADSTEALAVDTIISFLDLRYQAILNNEAGLYSALSDVDRFLEFGDSTDYATFPALRDTASVLRTAIAGLAGGHDALTISAESYNVDLTNQLLTVSQVDLTTDVTGTLPVANLPLQTTMTDTDASVPSPGAVMDWTRSNALMRDSARTVIYRRGVNATASVTEDTTFIDLDSAENLTITGNWVNTANPWADNEVANDITISNISQVQDITATATEINYTTNVTSDIQTQLNAKKDIADAETVFGLSFGVGNAGDTIIFQNGNYIYAVEWDGDYTLTITEVTVDAYHATETPDIDVALLSAATYRDGSPVEILSADITVTATEQNITSFNDAVIEPGEWFMIRIDEATQEPTQMSISIDGTKSE